MTSSKPINVTLTGYIPYSQNVGPAFALPIFSAPAQPGRYLVQEVDECTNVIGGFRLAAVQEDFLTPVSKNMTVRIGEKIVFVFIDERGEVLAGNLTEIAPALRVFLRPEVAWPGLRVQIAALIGSEKEKHRAYRFFEKHLTRNLSSSAPARIFRASVEYSKTWNLLLSEARTNDQKRKVLASRSRINLFRANTSQNSSEIIKLYSDRINYNSGLGFETGPTEEVDSRNFIALEKTRITVNGKMIAVISCGFSKTSVNYVVGPWRPGFSLFSVPDIDNIRAENIKTIFMFHINNFNKRLYAKTQELAANIVTLPSQNDRVLKLLRNYLDHPSEANWVINAYLHDTGKFIMLALHLVRDAISDNITKHDSVDSRVETVRRIIPALYANAFPMNCGAFLVSCARNFSDSPQVLSTVRELIEKTRSAYLQRELRSINYIINGDDAQKK